MNAKQFFDLVARMRIHQKEFFKTRSNEALQNSLALEREVDAEIARVQALLSRKNKDEKQYTLF